MNGFKVILLIGLMSMLGITTTAVAGGTTLFILLNNGNVEEYALQQKKPVIGFDGECVQIHSATVTVTTPYRYSDIKKLYFDVITSGSPVEPSQLDPTLKIADPKDAANTFFFAYDGNVVRLSGVGENPKVAVYSMNGVKVTPQMQINDQQVVLNVSPLPFGVYVIRVNDRSFKIVKK